MKQKVLKTQKTITTYKCADSPYQQTSYELNRITTQDCFEWTQMIWLVNEIIFKSNETKDENGEQYV